jgi:hypothetical protein
MKLKFLFDYLGRETAMKQYRKGDTDDFSTAQALELIRLEVAEEVVQEERAKFITDHFGKMAQVSEDFNETVERAFKKSRKKAGDQ